MAEGFDGCHIPQQSRRDKLRILTAPPCLEPSLNRHLGSGLLPLHDPPSLTSSDFQTCAAASIQDFSHHRTSLLPGPSEGCREGRGFAVKEGFDLVGNLLNPPSTSSSRMDQPRQDFFDLVNTSPIQVITTNTSFYSPPSLQNRRDFDHVYNDDGEVVVFKPEPLSLSLSSHPSYQNGHQLELNLQRYECGLFPAPIVGSIPNDISRSSVPLGPFTGYASILKGSRFLRPAQQLLEEFCGIWCQGHFNEKLEVDSSLMDSPAEALSAIVDDPLSSGGDGGERRLKKSKLISMIDEVYRRYKQSYQQMQEVVASFDCVSGLGNAAPYANLAVKAMSHHFRCLKTAIFDQLQCTSKSQSNFSLKYIQNSGFPDQQPAWRPQRGLPERAVTVLRAWLFEHFLHPYPTDTDKLMLAKQTGLSRSQVSNWFINARVRLWKPMVEDIHMLETRQTQKTAEPEEHSGKSTLPGGEISSKRTRNDHQGDRPMNLTYSNLPSCAPQVNVSAAIAGGGYGGGFRGGISLTLGLHQNNVVDLSEPFQITAVQRYGLGLNGSINCDGSVNGGCEVQRRRFGRDMIGGDLVHDFVG